MPKFKITEKLVNFLLIFILGFLVGVALKSEAQKRMTIGFNDYLVPKYKQNVDLMAPKNNPAQNNNQNPNQPNAQPAPDTQPAPNANNQ